MGVTSKIGFIRDIDNILKNNSKYANLKAQTESIKEKHIKGIQGNRNDIIHNGSYDEFSHQDEFFIKSIMEISDTTEFTEDDRLLVDQKVNESLKILGSKYLRELTQLEYKIYKVLNQLELLKKQ